MAEVSVALGERIYRIGCDDGQEEQLLALAKEVDRRLTDLRSRLGEIGGERLAIMAAIMLADELQEARRQVAALEGTAAELRESRDAMKARVEEAETEMVRNLTAAAERVEHAVKALRPPRRRGPGERQEP